MELLPWPSPQITRPSSREEWEAAVIPEMRRRAEMRLALDARPDHQARVLELSRRNPTWWIDNFVWSTDPHRIKEGKHPLLPLCLWEPWQVELVLSLLRGLLLLVEKPRKMGVTYVILATYLWAWNFVPQSTWGVSSTKFAKVYSDHEDSLFGKLLFMLRRLPPWMVPRYKLSAANGQATLVNLDTESAIIGAPATEDAWHGPRLTGLFFDEGARVPRLGSIMKGVLGAASSIAVASTPNGPGGWFARTRHGDGADIEPYVPGNVGSPGAWKLVTLNIEQDPRKDAAWLEEAQASMTAAELAEQYFVSYDASRDEGAIWPEFAEDLHVYQRRGDGSEYSWEDFVADGGLADAVFYEVWDPGLRAAVVWFAYSERRQVVVVLDYRFWHARHWEDVVADVGLAGWYSEPNPDLHSRETCAIARAGRIPHHRVTDPAGNARDSRTLRTWIGDFATRGIRLRETSNRDVEEGNRRVSMALRYEALLFSPACAEKLDKEHFGDVPTLIDCMRNYKLELGKARSVAEHKGGKPEPAKDQYSHGADCVRYGLYEIWGADEAGLARWDAALKQWIGARRRATPWG